MSTLYELTGMMLDLQDLLESGEYDEQTIADTMEGLQIELEEKADGYARIISNFEGSIEAIKAEKKRLDDRQKVYENNIKRLKANLEDSMNATGKRKFKTDLFSFTIQKNPVRVVIDDESRIPRKYFIKQEPKLDKKALSDALKEGDRYAQRGAHLEQGESLRIR